MPYIKIEIKIKIFKQLTPSSRIPANRRSVLGPLPPAATTPTDPLFVFVFFFFGVSSPSTSISSSSHPSSPTSISISISSSSSSSRLFRFRSAPCSLASTSALAWMRLGSSPALVSSVVSSVSVRSPAVRGSRVRFFCAFLTLWEVIFFERVCCADWASRSSSESNCGSGV